MFSKPVLRHLTCLLVCAAPLLTLPPPAGAAPLLALLPSAAAATALPGTTVLGTVSYNRGDRIDPVTFGHFEVSAAPFGGGELDIQGQPFAAVQASGALATDAATALLFVRSVGHLTFHFAIDGPPSSAVPVLIDVQGFATGLAGAGASFAVLSEWVLTKVSPGGELLATDLVQTDQMTGSFSQGFSRTVSLLLDTQSVYQVFMRADIGVAASDTNSAAQATAFIDPVFRFGNGVDTGQYRFVLGAGIGNQAPEPVPVPEPQTALLMVWGFALLAARRWRVCSIAARA
ncbi:MAG: hypothetical protein QM750_21125 [Rubrivivax sp.]